MDGQRRRGEAAFEELLRAASYAEGNPEQAWSFAVRIDVLRELGLSQNDLRWLVRSGYVQHRIEISALDELNILPRDQEEREFLPFDPLQALSSASCFMLTRLGQAFFSSQLEVAGRQRDGEHSSQHSPMLLPNDSHNSGFQETQLPQWNPVTLELVFHGRLVKQFKTSAPNQERVLDAFQEEGWPFHVDDPLPPIPAVDCKQRLHDTIKRLNGNQRVPLLLFVGDGKGRGICWQIRRDVASDDLGGHSNGSTSTPEGTQLSMGGQLPAEYPRTSDGEFVFDTALI